MRGLAPGRVLEVGCLDGRYLEVLRGRGWSVAGLDIQPSSKTFIAQHDAARPFPFSQEFDVVIAVEVIEHLVETDDFLSHCAAVLRPGGHLILTTPNLLFGVNRILMLFGRTPRFAYAEYHVRMFVRRDLEHRIRKLFDVIAWSGSHVLAGVRHGRAFVVFEMLGDRFPNFAAHFIVVARLRAHDAERRRPSVLDEQLRPRRTQQPDELSPPVAPGKSDVRQV